MDSNEIKEEEKLKLRVNKFNRISNLLIDFKRIIYKLGKLIDFHDDKTEMAF